MAQSSRCINLSAHGRCRRCSGCLYSRLRSWVFRMKLEAMSYPEDQVTFCTFTYSDDYLPGTPGEALEQFQKFLKRLRKIYPEEIRYVAALEEGEKNGRMHWHAIIYGLIYCNSNRHFLEKAWSHGFIDFQVAGTASMDYVLKYVIKGNKFVMSRRPGIGARMLDYLNGTIDSLSSAEIEKLRAKNSVAHVINKFRSQYARQSRTVSALKVGGFYFPLHAYVKNRLRDMRIKL